MSDNEHFENVVLGGGEAGKYIAWELTRAGQGTAVINQQLADTFDLFSVSRGLDKGLWFLEAHLQA